MKATMHSTAPRRAGKVVSPRVSLCDLSPAVTPRQFDSVLCFGDSDWWYHNRGHADMQFMRRFARHCPVLYVNSLGVKAPSLSDGRAFLRRVMRKATSVARFLRDGGEGFDVLSPVYWPAISGLSGRISAAALAIQIRAALRGKGMRRPLVWAACPTAAVIIHRVRGAPLVHQLSDCYTAIENDHCESAGRFEAVLAERSDLLLCASRKLHDRARELYAKGEYLDHGVDFDLFAAQPNGNPPAELAGAVRPIVGFFGNIDGNTVDRSLLDAAITARPQYTFALVGPMAADFRMLRRHANVIALPQQPYRDIPRFGACFDVCLMPWLQNEWIEHCNPVKLKEYLALGKPVVSTPYPELSASGAPCYVARGPHQFAAAIDTAIAEDNSSLQAARRGWAARHTWDAKFSRVLELLAAREIHLEN